MIKTRVIWLVPGLENQVFKRFADFFALLFEHFESFDYRAAYLNNGQVFLEGYIQSLVKKWEPHVVIYTQFPSTYSFIKPEFLASLRKSCHVVGFGYDDEIYFEQAKWFYQACSCVITTDIAGAEWLRQAEIPAYLAQLQQPQPMRMSSTIKEDIPVSFVGDMSKPGRRKYVEYLELNGIPVAEFGAGSRGGKVSDSQMFDIYCRSKVNLNFTSTNPPKWILRQDPFRSRFGQIKGRPFELAEIGKFCLCEWAPCVECWFRPGIEIGVFRDPEDLLCQVRRYLEDDLLRRQVSASAQVRHGAEFAPELQFTRIFSTILSSPRPAEQQLTGFGNTVFYESMGRSRGVAFLHALHRKSPIRALSEPFTAHAMRLDYWRGFVGGVVDTLANQLLRV